MSTHTVDARRLLCPMPVIRTQDAVSKLQAGDRVEVSCTDPGAKLDIPAWCRINGHKIIEISDDRDNITITLEVGGLGT
ncbi:MAG: sulfurtransferase TusA family protein [Gammaproteobacteria bacterium]|nr:sulfurtransferase TusA family protein [Gammaproteobacteria bacterium]MDH5801147.1 sulfurtransferase TusA family protein [Gammaproteobacteria bacterium]